MKYFLTILFLALVGCDPKIVPQIDRVDTRQDHTPASTMVVTYLSIDDQEALTGICEGKSRLGCTIWSSEREIQVYVYSGGSMDATKAIAMHEFTHVVFGPQHF